MGPTVGFGLAHPSLPALLSDRTPILITHATWGAGLDLEISLYAGAADLPDELVSSIRCLVIYETQVLVCSQGVDAASLLPGGRREAGETWRQTAIREVHEETGWTVAADSLEVLGFLHFRHLTNVPDGHAFPHPDFLQVVLCGEGAPGPEGWVDTEGYVTRSWQVPLAAATALPLGPIDLAVLALADGLSAGC